MESIHVQWNEGDEDRLIVDERVPADPTCGQYETGWVAFRAENPDCEYFISDTGWVYALGEGNTTVGHAPEIMEDYNRRERELDNLLAQEGM